MAADLRPVEGGTEIVLFRPPMGVRNIVASLKQWFDGDPAPCPKLKQTPAKNPRRTRTKVSGSG